MQIDNVMFVKTREDFDKEFRYTGQCGKAVSYTSRGGKMYISHSIADMAKFPAFAIINNTAAEMEIWSESKLLSAVAELRNERKKIEKAFKACEKAYIAFDMFNEQQQKEKKEKR